MAFAQFPGAGVLEQTVYNPMPVYAQQPYPDNEQFPYSYQGQASAPPTDNFGNNLLQVPGYGDAWSTPSGSYVSDAAQSYGKCPTYRAFAQILTDSMAASTDIVMSRGVLNRPTVVNHSGQGRNSSHGHRQDRIEVQAGENRLGGVGTHVLPTNIDHGATIIAPPEEAKCCGCCIIC